MVRKRSQLRLILARQLLGRHDKIAGMVHGGRVGILEVVSDSHENSPCRWGRIVISDLASA
jgi:hypothetical protein